MFKQSISIIEFPNLYNILNEIKDLFKFNIYNYKNLDDFKNNTQFNETEFINSTLIILKEKNDILLSTNKVNENTILVLDKLPISVEKLLDTINTRLIKQKYNFQSNINIKNYILNLNTRVISQIKKELKLTEREIDIILFLKDHKNPQSINDLQNLVWKHSFNLETHTVETHIYRLRKKIKDKFNDQDFIISQDKGYSI